MSFKIKVHKECIQQLNNRITYLQEALHDLTTGAANEGKSSAGDKHETSRAMMQLEHEKISRQVAEVLLQKATMEQLDPNLHSLVAGMGSILKTNQGYLYISIALGKINVEGREVITLSAQSPLGGKLNGLKASAVVEMNGTQFIIEEVS